METHFKQLAEQYGGHTKVADALGISPRVYFRWRTNGFASLRQAEMVSQQIKRITGHFIPPQIMLTRTDNRTKRVA